MNCRKAISGHENTSVQNRSINMYLVSKYAMNGKDYSAQLSPNETVMSFRLHHLHIDPLTSRPSVVMGRYITDSHSKLMYSRKKPLKSITITAVKRKIIDRIRHQLYIIEKYNLLCLCPSKLKTKLMIWTDIDVLW